MTHPSVETTQSGEAADAVRVLQTELSSAYSELRSAEIQLTEAILSAHAVTVSGRARLQDIQRQLIEAINNPVMALDTPAGERQFLMFLRTKLAEIQDIVDTGALTDEDHANLTRALGGGYLMPTSGREQDQAAGMIPAVGSALGAVPQLAQGAATAPAQGLAGLAGAAGPLTGLASGLLDHTGEADRAEDDVDQAPTRKDSVDVDGRREPDAEEDDTDDRPGGPQPPSDPEPQPERGPAQTRPARLL